MRSLVYQQIHFFYHTLTYPSAYLCSCCPLRVVSHVACCSHLFLSVRCFCLYFFRQAFVDHTSSKLHHLLFTHTLFNLSFWDIRYTFWRRRKNIGSCIYCTLYVFVICARSCFSVRTGISDSTVSVLFYSASSCSFPIRSVCPLRLSLHPCFPIP